MSLTIPKVLIIDDLFGRDVPSRYNRERENLCGKFLLSEIPQKGISKSSRFEISDPVAHVVFYRGQIPSTSGVGAVVENDLQSSLEIVRAGWSDALEKGEIPWAMVLLDLCFYTGRVTEESNRRTLGMPEGRPGDDEPSNYFGLTLLDAIHQEFPELPIFILSSKPREEVSLEFSKRGALGFIDRSDIRGPELLQEALWHHGLLPDPTGEIVGNSLQLLLALRKARQAAKLRENVLIRGELGTGKELMAKYIHRVSSTANSSKHEELVTMDASHLTPEMFSSEMFGIKPRTATGVDGNIGWIEVANGSDLFLDEVANMRPDVQPGFLRVLQNRKITPVGSRKTKSIDVRFISASNAFLENETKFKPDLLDRLRLGGTIWLPPLRERKTDIPLLVEGFIREAEGKQVAMRREITPEALDLLMNHNWPGNIRELRTCIFGAVSSHPDVEHLVPAHIQLINYSVQDPKNIIPNIQLNEPQTQKQHAKISNSIDDFLEIMNSFNFDHLGKNQLMGNLGDLEYSFAWFLARYLNASIDETRKGQSIENPKGNILYTPAFTLIAGDPYLSPDFSKKQIRRLLEPLKDELTDDLLELYEVIKDPKKKSIKKHPINKLPRKRSIRRIQ